MRHHAFVPILMAIALEFTPIAYENIYYNNIYAINILILLYSY